MHTNPYDGAFNDPYDLGNERPTNGLTKREYFAAMAMQGLMANPEESKDASNSKLPFDVNIRDLMSIAVHTADSLIAALNTEQP